jgi:ELWxxDGT repeat protein
MKRNYLFIATLLVSYLTMAQAPTLVGDLNPGPDNFVPSFINVFNGSLYFGADDSSGTNTGGVDVGRELWKSDGTAAGTVLVKDIRTGSANSSPFNFFIFNSNFYFTANDGAAELWTSDGTEAGTVKVDLLPSINGDVPNNATNYISQVFLTVNANGDNGQLFEWDGINGDFAADAVNPAATTEVREIVQFDNGLYLYMSYSADDALDIGFELYKYDVATDTYSLISDIAPGLNGSGNPNSSGISNFTPFLTELYFEAESKLYQTDGTVTIEVPAAVALNLDNVTNLFRFGDFLLFEADNGITGDQLYRLDNTTGIITALSAIAGANNDHDPSDYALGQGVVYYAAEDNVDNEQHLWSTDGTTITQLDDTITKLDDITIFNDKVYFEGEGSDTIGLELYVYDPATASISQLTGLGSIQIALNPLDNIIYLKGETSLVKSYNIYDLAGRNVQSGVLKGKSISNQLSSGTYILKLQGNKTSKSFKFIKE